MSKKQSFSHRVGTPIGSPSGPRKAKEGGNPRAQAQQAKEALQAGRIWQAEEICRGLLARDPDFAPALVVMGMVAGQTGRVDHGIQLLARACARLKDDIEANHALAILYRQRGLAAEAEAIWLRILEQNPNHAEANNYMGILRLM